MFEEDFRARAIAAGVSEFHWGEVPQDTELPFALAETINDPRPAHLKGYTGLRRTRVQVRCFSKTAKEAKLMAEALIAALSPPATEGATRFNFSPADGPSDRTQDVSGKTVHVQLIEFAVNHRQL
jgi:hypothetical protein